MRERDAGGEGKSRLAWQIYARGEREREIENSHVWFLGICEKSGAVVTSRGVIFALNARFRGELIVRGVVWPC